jgi:hypothetical protein
MLDDGQLLFQSLTTTTNEKNDAQVHGDQVIAEEVKDSLLMIPQQSNGNYAFSTINNGG